MPDGRSGAGAFTSGIFGFFGSGTGGGADDSLLFGKLSRSGKGGVPLALATDPFLGGSVAASLACSSFDSLGGGAFDGDSLLATLNPAASAKSFWNDVAVGGSCLQGQSANFFRAAADEALFKATRARSASARVNTVRFADPLAVDDPPARAALVELEPLRCGKQL